MPTDNNVVLDKEGVPTSFRAFKVGHNLDYRGVDAIYDPKDAKAIVAANTRDDGSVPIDLAHGMVAGNDARPESHEALGWGKLRCDETGVWLDDIRWTPETREKLKAKKLRFTSPTFTMRQRGKKTYIDNLITVSLTNIPATKHAQPLVEMRSLDAVHAFAAAMVVQTLIFSKDKFKSVAQAKKWASDHGFKGAAVDETDDSYRLRQRDPAGFAPSSFRTVPLTKGVTAVMGKLKRTRSATNPIDRKDTMATKKLAQDLEVTKREEEEDEEESKEPIVREDNEDGDEDTGHDEPDGDEPDGDEDDDDLPDPEDADVDAMDEATVRKFAKFLVDEYMTMKASIRSREEEEESREEEEKRDIVRALHVDAYIKYDDKKGLMALSLRDLRKKERVLRSGKRPSVKVEKREAAAVTAKASLPEQRKDIVNTLGVDDAALNEFIKRNVKPETAKKLGLDAATPGQVWGATMFPKKANKEEKGNAR